MTFERWLYDDRSKQLATDEEKCEFEEFFAFLRTIDKPITNGRNENFKLWKLEKQLEKLK